jgi:hypothetical protein
MTSRRSGSVNGRTRPPTFAHRRLRIFQREIAGLVLELRLCLANLEARTAFRLLPMFIVLRGYHSSSALAGLTLNLHDGV